MNSSARRYAFWISPLDSTPLVGTVKKPVSRQAARMSSRICVLVLGDTSPPRLDAASSGETSTSGSCCSATLAAVITHGDEKLLAPTATARGEAGRRRAANMAKGEVLTRATSTASTWCGTPTRPIVEHGWRIIP
jgi:hypothetical protein